MKKSLGVSAVLNTINTLLGMFFPLITFPYISRVFGANYVGKINFSNSVVSYFALIAALGITTYATREGAIVRENRQKFNDFANEVFTINIVSTFVAYAIMFASILTVPIFKPYLLVMGIQSISLLSTTIGINWLYTIYEDYIYIVTRNVIFQIISLCFLFLFVHEKEDYIIYCIISMISTCGSNVCNLFYSKKYIDLKLTSLKNCLRHIKSILLIFTSTIASTIYVNSDNILLGVLSGDYYVGIYSISVKIYMILKSLINSVFGVTLPRVSMYLSNQKEKEALLIIQKVFIITTMILLPIVVGVNLLCDEVILIIGGSEYYEAAMSLRLLMIALVFSIYASFYSTLILLPQKREQIITWTSIGSAVLNIVLNFFFIKLWRQDGAAFTTVISEIVVCLVYYVSGNKLVKMEIKKKEIIKILVATIIMTTVGCLIKTYNFGWIINCVVMVSVCALVYVLSLFFLKSETIKWAFMMIIIEGESEWIILQD